jgi:hypothetical protein
MFMGDPVPDEEDGHFIRISGTRGVLHQITRREMEWREFHLFLGTPFFKNWNLT